MSQLFASDGQSIGASASVSVLPMNIQAWFTLGLTGCSLPFAPKHLFFYETAVFQLFPNLKQWLLHPGNSSLDSPVNIAHRVGQPGLDSVCSCGLNHAAMPHLPLCHQPLE